MFFSFNENTIWLDVFAVLQSPNTLVVLNLSNYLVDSCHGLPVPVSASVSGNPAVCRLACHKHAATMTDQ